MYKVDGTTCRTIYKYLSKSFHGILVLILRVSEQAITRKEAYHFVRTNKRTYR